MNDTLGPKDIVPSSLIFGEFPSLRTFEGPVIPWPTLEERSIAAQVRGTRRGRSEKYTGDRKAVGHELQAGDAVGEAALKPHTAASEVLTVEQRLTE